MLLGVFVSSQDHTAASGSRRSRPSRLLKCRTAHRRQGRAARRRGAANPCRRAPFCYRTSTDGRQSRDQMPGFPVVDPRAFRLRPLTPSAADHPISHPCCVQLSTLRPWTVGHLPPAGSWNGGRGRQGQGNHADGAARGTRRARGQTTGDRRCRCPLTSVR